MTSKRMKEDRGLPNSNKATPEKSSIRGNTPELEYVPVEGDICTLHRLTGSYHSASALDLTVEVGTVCTRRKVCNVLTMSLKKESKRETHTDIPFHRLEPLI